MSLPVPKQSRLWAVCLVVILTTSIAANADDWSAQCNALAGSKSEPGNGGQGVSREDLDAGKAIETCRHAVAEIPNAQNLFRLGRALDKAGAILEALDVYQKAASLGYAPAQWALGAAYALGKGFSPNYAQAVDWSRMAAEQGFAPAQHNLGWMHENGLAVPQSYGRAACRRRGHRMLPRPGR